MFVLCCSIYSSEGLILRKTYDSLDIYTFLDKFSFSGKIGHLSLDLHQISGDPTLAICTRAQWQEVVTSGRGVQDIFCDSDGSADYSARASFPCEIPLVSLRNESLRDYDVAHTDIYSIMIIHCSVTAHASASFTLTLTNGNSQLPYGEQGLTTLYPVILFLWMLFLIWWLFQTVRHRRIPQNLDDLSENAPTELSNGIRLHLAFALVICFKILVIFSSYIYWSEYEQTGYPSSTFRVSSTFLFSASECFLFTVLLLVAKGWKITVDRVSSSEARSTIFTLLFLLASLFFFSVYEDGYYFLSLMILYFFLVPKVFHAISLNSGMLRSYSLFLQNRFSSQTPAIQANILRLLSALKLKSRMYASLRFEVTVYVCLIVATYFIKLIVSFTSDWLIAAIQEIYIIFLVAQFCLSVRPSLARHGLFSMHYELFSDSGLAFPVFFGSDGTLPLWDNSVEFSPDDEEEFNTNIAAKSFLLSFPHKDSITDISDIPIALAVDPELRSSILPSSSN